MSYLVGGVSNGQLGTVQWEECKMIDRSMAACSEEKMQSRSTKDSRKDSALEDLGKAKKDSRYI
ncbi:hypothetical protein JZ751_014144 [Albula glossodonta]|uniref:Uncharacterized protein n=1 Tax=Albula glossodonta TaxID=121402 RepID=A0A8T2P3F1_9TELE|nr:hypothetical protein JZ751_014144 [Albula glossodonta]